MLPPTASAVSVICGLMMIYAIGSPRGTTAFQTTPQGTCIILAALASLASILMCLGVPNMSRRHRSRKPIPIKRMNLLGLVGSSEVCLCSCVVCSAACAVWSPDIIGLCGTCLVRQSRVSNGMLMCTPCSADLIDMVQVISNWTVLMTRWHTADLSYICIYV